MLKENPVVMLSVLSTLLLASLAWTREIIFPPVAAIQQQHPISPQGEHDLNGPIDISGAQYAGLMTYANLPYVHCLAAEGIEVEGYDIAVLGAPFDTVSLYQGWRMGLRCR